MIDELTTDLDSIPKTYEQAVKLLATAHASGTERIEIEFFLIPDSDKQAVRLVEVSKDFPEGAAQYSTTDAYIVPVFAMGKSKDFPFRSEIAQVTPDEWRQLCSGNLKLNRQWDLNTAKKVQI